MTWEPLLIILLLATVLLTTVLAFEVDMRFFTDWEVEAADSPYYRADSWNAVWTAGWLTSWSRGTLSRPGIQRAISEMR